MPEFEEVYVIKNARCIKSTQKAILVTFDGTMAWFPQSQIDDESEVWKRGQSGTLVVSLRCAKGKGLV